MGKKAISYLFYCVSIVITVLIAAATVLSAKTGHFVPKNHPFISMLGPFLVVLITADILFFIYWVIRLKVIAIVPFIAVMFSLSYTASIYYPANHWPLIGKAGKAATVKKTVVIKNITPVNLKVATFNVGGFGGDALIKNVKSAADYFCGRKGIPMADAIHYAPAAKASAPVDILCLEEYAEGWDFGRDSIKKQLNTLPYSCFDRKGTKPVDMAIFSKYQIKRYCFAQFPESNYGFIYADIAIDSTKIIRVIAVHFESTGVSNISSDVAYAERTNQKYSRTEMFTKLTDKLKFSSGMRGKQVDIICNMIKKSPYPVLLMGDFNDTPNSYAYVKCSRLLIDTFRECGQGYTYSYRHFQKLFRIDYIFHSADFKGINYFSPDGPWSDHNAVIAECQLL